MAAINTLTVDFTPSALRSWQTLKPPVTASETVLTATKLMDDIWSVSAAQSTFYAVPISAFQVIQVMMLGDGADNNSPIADFYGWGETGPGHRLGRITTDLSTATHTADTGFISSPRTHASIRRDFSAATTWRAADQYVISSATAPAEHRFTDDTLHTQYFRCLEVPGTSASGGTIGTATTEANFPQVFNLNFGMSDFSYLVTTIQLQGTSAGLIFRVVKMKGAMTAPRGV